MSIHVHIPITVGMTVIWAEGNYEDDLWGEVTSYNGYTGHTTVVWRGAKKDNAHPSNPGLRASRFVGMEEPWTEENLRNRLKVMEPVPQFSSVREAQKWLATHAT